MPAILLAKFLGKRIVLDYRSPVPLSRIGSRTFLYQRIWKLCDRVLVPSAYQRHFVSSFGGRAEYLPASAPVKEIAPRVVRSVQPRILVSTELEREHNVACAIRAFQLVKQKYPRTELVVIGLGSQRVALERLAMPQKSSGITFAGSVNAERRHELYEKSEVFINCSSVDHLSRDMVEAFAHGLPVISTPITGITDVFRDSGNMLLLSYNDHVGLADQVIKLVEEPDLTERLSVTARETAQRYADWATHQRRRGLYRRRNT